MPETAPPPADLAGLGLAEIARLAEERRLPPVEKWNPTHCGDSAMRIARDGTWFHEGSPIGRPAMVRLFSTILRREPDGGYVLVTPVEKLDIAVEDAPFVAVELKSEGEGRDAHARLPAQHRRSRRRRAASTRCASRPRRRPASLSPCPRRAGGAGRPAGLLRAGRARARRGRRSAGPVERRRLLPAGRRRHEPRRRRCARR